MDDENVYVDPDTGEELSADQVDWSRFDAVPEEGFFERTGKRLWGNTLSTVGNIIGGGEAILAEQLPESVSDFFGWDAIRGRALQAAGQRLRDRYEQSGRMDTSGYLGYGADLFSKGSATVAGMVPALLAGGPIGLGAQIGLDTMGGEYAQLRDRDIPAEEALNIAGERGAFDAGSMALLPGMGAWGKGYLSSIPKTALTLELLNIAGAGNRALTEQTMVEGVPLSDVNLERLRDETIDPVIESTPETIATGAILGPVGRFMHGRPKTPKLMEQDLGDILPFEKPPVNEPPALEPAPTVATEKIDPVKEVVKVEPPAPKKAPPESDFPEPLTERGKPGQERLSSAYWIEHYRKLGEKGPRAANGPFGYTSSPDRVPTVTGDSLKFPENIEAKRRPLSSEDRAVEDRFIEKIRKDPAGIVEDFIEKHTEPSGTVVIDTDAAREFSDDYAKDLDSKSKYSNAVHEPASAIAEEAYTRLLARDPVFGDVQILGGGGGAGKSTSRAMFPGEYDIVYDTTLSSKKSAERKIEAALQSGRGVEVLFTWSGVENGAARALARSVTNGRTVPYDVLAKAHYQAPRVFLELVDQYREKPIVKFNAVDNSGERPRIISIEELREKAYNDGEGGDENVYVTKARDAYERTAAEISGGLSREALGRIRRGLRSSSEEPSREIRAESSAGAEEPASSSGSGETRSVLDPTFPELSRKVKDQLGPGEVAPELSLMRPQKPVTEFETIDDYSDFRLARVPLEQLAVSKNFKAGSEGEGQTVPERRIKGKKFIENFPEPVVVWRRLDGTTELVTGRHRTEHRRNLGKKDALAWVYDEAAGWTREHMDRLDRFQNLRQGNASAVDYLNVFAEYPDISRQYAEDHGLLHDPRGRAAFTVAREAGPELQANVRAVDPAVREARISVEQAAAIAEVAPRSRPELAGVWQSIQRDMAEVAIRQNARPSELRIATENTVDIYKELQASGADSQTELFGAKTFERAASISEKAIIYKRLLKLIDSEVNNAARSQKERNQALQKVIGASTKIKSVAQLKKYKASVKEEIALANKLQLDKDLFTRLAAGEKPTLDWFYERKAAREKGELPTFIETMKGYTPRPVAEEAGGVRLDLLGGKLIEGARDKIREEWERFRAAPDRVDSILRDLAREGVKDAKIRGQDIDPSELFLRGRIFGKDVPGASEAARIVRKHITRPKALAKRNPAAKAVWENRRERYYWENKKNFEFAEQLNPFLDLLDQTKVAKALASAREQSFKHAEQGKRLVVTPEKLKEAGLSDAEVKAYEAVRGTLDSAWKFAEEQLLEHYKQRLTPENYLKKASEIKEFFFEKRVANYVPIHRFGDLFVHGTGPAGENWYSLHESLSEQRETAKNMAKRGYSVQVGKVRKPQDAAYENMPNDLAFDLNALLKDPAWDPNQPVDGFKGHLLRAKLVPGYELDFKRNMANYISSLVQWAGKLKFEPEQKELLSRIDPKSPMYQEMSDWLNYTNSNAKEFGKLRSVLGHYYLGLLNPAAAALNSTQIFTVTYPELRRYTSNPLKALNRAQKAYRRYNRAPEEFAKEEPILYQAIQDGIESGMLHDEMARELFNIRAGRQGTLKSESWSDLSMLFNRVVERRNRIVSFIAGYENAPKGEDPIEFARNFVEDTQFIYSRLNRPRIARGAKAPFYTFRLYGHNYWGNIREAMEDVVKLTAKARGAESPEAKAAAKEQAKAAAGVLARYGGSIGLLGGAAALPFVREIVAAAAANGVDLKKELREYLGNETAADVMIYGPAAPLLGITLTGAVAPSEFLAMDKGPSAAAEKLTFGVVSDFVRKPARALEAYDNSGSVARGLEELAPRTIKNMMQAYRWASRGRAEDIKGRTVMDDPTPLEIISKALSFQPARYTRAQEKAGAVEIVKDNAASETEGLLQKMALAVQNGDGERLKELFTHAAEIGYEVKPQAIMDRVMQNQNPDYRAYKSTPKRARSELAEVLRTYGNGG